MTKVHLQPGWCVTPPQWEMSLCAALRRRGKPQMRHQSILPCLDSIGGEGSSLPLKPLHLQAVKGAKLWLAGPFGDEFPERLWSTLSRAERDRADRFLRSTDRVLFVMTRGILRFLLGEATGIAAEEIAFAEGPFGKPYLSRTDGPHFNVSHSGAYALIGLSRNRPVGVDIEKIRSTGDELNVARNYFSDAEICILQSLEMDALNVAFYRIWTCKEAVLKAYGAGVSQHLKDFSIHLTPQGYAVLVESDRLPYNFAQVVAEPAPVPQGYVGCCVLA